MFRLVNLFRTVTTANPRVQYVAGHSIPRFTIHWPPARLMSSENGVSGVKEQKIYINKQGEEVFLDLYPLATILGSLPNT